jgi:halogenation protein CepH
MSHTCTHIGDLMSSDSQQYDVCVVGSGPAGSTVASFIAMAGHKVLLVEKESLPIYKIGESLLPSTIHGVCSLLGVTEELAKQNFVKKFGGTFCWGRNKEPWTFAFAESSRFPGPTSHAYQVERVKFDAILLENAKRKGVEVRERTRAHDLITDGTGRVSGIVLVDEHGFDVRVQCRYVVDASGHASNLSRHVGNRWYSELFRNIALFGYFNDGDRLPPPKSGNIFCAAFDKGWFWYIPLSQTLTSVGAVIGKEHSSCLSQGLDRAFTLLIEECGPIKKLLSSATLSTVAPYNKIRTRSDYSYCHNRFWKPGIVLIGDAACFIDPVFSSGVHLATYSALLAARSINTCLQSVMSEDVSFAEFETRYRREYGLFYEFLAAFYNLDQDLDSYYWAARKLLAMEERSNEAFVSLVGGNASGELIPGGSHNGGAQTGIRGEHLFPAAMGTSTDTYLESGGRSSEGSRFWKELNSEGHQLQLRGALPGMSMTERPIVRDGLVPSSDGLHWADPSVDPLFKGVSSNR